jgi:hypothetical protein
MDEDPPELPTKLKLKVTALFCPVREPFSELSPEDPTKLQLKLRCLRAHITSSPESFLSELSPVEGHQAQASGN